MGSVRKLCPRTILVKDGNTIMDSITNGIINYYLKCSENETDSVIKLPPNVKKRFGMGLPDSKNLKKYLK